METTHDSSGLKLFSDDNVVSREIEVCGEEKFIDQLKNLPKNEIPLFFEISRCVEWIKQNGYERIALQFPDCYLNYAYNVVEAIELQLPSLDNYAEMAKYLVEKFTGKNIHHCSVACDIKDEKENIVLGRNMSGYNEDIDNVVVVFVGSPDSPFLTLWLMTFINTTKAVIYNPVNEFIEVQTSIAARLLRKRLFLIEKVRDAETLGLVVGTLGVGGHNEAVKRVRELCKAMGKKLYVLSIGKLNEAKLANFANEIDVFVLLSCPFGVLMDSAQYYRPLVCLFEAEIGLNANKNWYAGKGWTAEFLKFIGQQIGETDMDDVDVSLITGKVRRTNLNEKNEDGCQDVQLYSAKDTFGQRSWKGLDASIKDEEDLSIKEGIHGIAANYVSEPFNK
uniref:2-(3-amino-3-carboxypropyl)histidine synthase subunit 2 n=1 Tax=Rhabditophanes sp. KR3021 TaxID=114890 RepID=A0AC35UHK8_9BILA